MHLKTHGIVLAQTPFGSQDKLLTLLTSEQGLVTAVAKNPGRGKSKISAACEMLAYSEFCLFSGRTRYIVDSAELENNFFSLRSNLTGLSLAAYLAELTRFVMPQKETAEETLRLLLNTLYLLQKGEKSETMLKGIYELRLMCLSGFQPDVGGCAACGKEDGNFWLLPGDGILLCDDCFPEYQKMSERQVSRVIFPEAVEKAFLHVITAPMQKLFAFRLSDDAEKAFGEAAEAFTLFQTGGKFGTLDFYKAML